MVYEQGNSIEELTVYFTFILPLLIMSLSLSLAAFLVAISFVVWRVFFSRSSFNLKNVPGPVSHSWLKGTFETRV